jgi:DNA-binding CsgD family transcriptional regulator
VHRDAIAAEAIAGALSRFAAVLPVGGAPTAGDGEERARQADAVALDIRVPGAIEACGRLRRSGVHVVLIAEGNHLGRDVVTIPPTASIAQLASALVPGAAEEEARADRLTPREEQILSLVARGLIGKQVARHLGISPKTVEQHKTRIFAKLGVPNQAAAVRRVFATGPDRSDVWNRSAI